MLVYVLSPMRSALGIAHTDSVSYEARIASPRRLSRVFVYGKKGQVSFVVADCSSLSRTES